MHNEMDGMTIDEAIKYFDEDAEENAKLATIYKGNDDDLAEMHKQDANRSAYVSVWLRELKAYREAEKEIEQELVNWNDIDNGKCRGLFLATSIIQHYKNEEVNADDNSRFT